ncbi:MAG: pilus assembly protein N-terminal domain-containing protein [Dongiaceae bacterium]
MNKSFKNILRPSAVAALMIAATLFLAHSADADQALTIDLNGVLPLALRAPAKDVIVGNPAIADVSMQSPDHLVLIGKQAGRTRLLVLDANHKVVLNQIIIVTEGDVGMVSVYGPRGGTMTQSDYACGYHCSVISGPASSNSGGGGIVGGSNGSGSSSGNYGSDNGSGTAPATTQ